MKKDPDSATLRLAVAAVARCGWPKRPLGLVVRIFASFLSGMEGAVATRETFLCCNGLCISLDRKETHWFLIGCSLSDLRLQCKTSTCRILQLCTWLKFGYCGTLALISKWSKFVLFPPAGIISTIQGSSKRSLMNWLSVEFDSEY